jgi:L-2,4-diaminobutyric acid acetyltransferase
MQHSAQTQTASTVDSEILFRNPTSRDGTGVHALVARCPPLDANSLYCNLLQCSMFSSTCVVAEQHNQVVGFISGFVPPDVADSVFVWQVAVASEARGLGLARSMLLELLSRPACQVTTQLQTTITPGNAASWALFNSLARALDTDISSRVIFDRQQHLNNQHDSELLVTIGRFTPRAVASASLKSRLRQLN